MKKSTEEIVRSAALMARESLEVSYRINAICFTCKGCMIRYDMICDMMILYDYDMI